MTDSARSRKRKRLFDLQGGLCHWCKGPMTLERARPFHQPPDFATFEHLQAQSRGGSDGGGNVVLACRDCNWHRGAMAAPAADAPTAMSIGQRTMAGAIRVPSLRDNQMAILRWLFELGHEIDDDEFFEELADDQFVWILRTVA